MSQKRGRRGI